MRRRFWRAVAKYAMRRADLGYSPPLQWYRIPPTTTSNGQFINVTYHQP